MTIMPSAFNPNNNKVINFTCDYEQQKNIMDLDLSPIKFFFLFSTQGKINKNDLYVRCKRKKDVILTFVVFIVFFFSIISFHFSIVLVKMCQRQRRVEITRAKVIMYTMYIYKTY